MIYLDWKDARIIRDDNCYILAFFGGDGAGDVICGGRFSSKKDAETALHIAIIISSYDNTDRRITSKLQDIVDGADFDEDEELDLWF